MSVTYLTYPTNKCIINIHDDDTDTDLPISYRMNITKVYITFHTSDFYFPNLPPNITHLAVENFRYKPQYIPIPKTITGLYFNGTYEHPITLPNHITTFQMPRKYDYPIVLPPNIRTFVVLCEVKHPITFTDLYPTSLYLDYDSLLTNHLCTSPMMYYLTFCHTYHYSSTPYIRYLKNLTVRININKCNRTKRQQGLFDTLYEPLEYATADTIIDCNDNDIIRNRSRSI